MAGCVLRDEVLRAELIKDRDQEAALPCNTVELGIELADPAEKEGYEPVHMPDTAPTSGLP